MDKVTENEIPYLIERLRRYGKTKNLREDEVDDFSQEAAFALYRGRKATFRQLYVDYLRKTYGDTRTSSGVEKSRQTLQYASIDENMFGGGPGNGLSDREATRHIAKICEVLSYNEYLAILDDNDIRVFSQSRRSQLQKSARKKIKKYEDYQRAYSSMETEDLWISYIVIS